MAPLHCPDKRCNIQKSIDNGAKTIVFRTSEVNITPAEVRSLITEQRLITSAPSPYNRDITALEFIDGHTDIQFVIEVGNEPDQAGTAISTYRTNLLDVYDQVVVDNLRANLQWIASAPTLNATRNFPGQTLGTYSYTEAFYTSDSRGSVQRKYHGIGVHMYGFGSLQLCFPGVECDGIDPGRELDYAMANLPPGDVIHVTEVNINPPTPWGMRGDQIVYAMQRAPWQIRSWEIFTADRVEPVTQESPNGTSKWCDGRATHYSWDTGTGEESGNCTINTTYPGSARLNAR